MLCYRCVCIGWITISAYLMLVQFLTLQCSPSFLLTAKGSGTVAYAIGTDLAEVAIGQDSHVTIMCHGEMRGPITASMKKVSEEKRVETTEDCLLML